jgi:hypothetical protein
MLLLGVRGLASVVEPADSNVAVAKAVGGSVVGSPGDCVRYGEVLAIEVSGDAPDDRGTTIRRPDAGLELPMNAEPRVRGNVAAMLPTETLAESMPPPCLLEKPLSPRVLALNAVSLRTPGLISSRLAISSPIYPFVAPLVTMLGLILPALSNFIRAIVAGERVDTGDCASYEGYAVIDMVPDPACGAIEFAN